MICRSIIGAIALGVISTAAHAATYTFDFTDPGLGSNHSSLYVASNEDAGFGVTIDAFLYTLNGGNYALGASRHVDTNPYGLISKNGKYEEHTIDSRKGYELMRFVFDGDKAVTLSNVIISWSQKWVGGSSYSKKSGGDTYGMYDIFTDDTYVGNTSVGPVVPAGPANSLAIGTRSIKQDFQSWCYRRDHSRYKCYKYEHFGIKIESITVEYVEPPKPAVIPLPAAGWLLLGALGGLGAMRRRKTG